MRRLVIPLCASLLFLSAPVTATDSPYRIDPGTSVRNGNLKVEPTVTGPAGQRVRYEVSVRREGGSGSSNSNQAGNVRLDDRGHGELASSSVSVRPNESYEVVVKLFADDRLVAQKSARHP